MQDANSRKFSQTINYKAQITLSDEKIESTQEPKPSPKLTMLAVIAMFGFPVVVFSTAIYAP